MELDDRRPDVLARINRRDRTVPGDISAYKQLGGATCEIVGVADNVRMLGLDAEVEPTIYADMRQWDISFGTRLIFAVRARNSPESIPTLLRSALRDSSAVVSVERISTMDDLVNSSIGGRGSNMLLLVTSVAFGALSLLLAGIGVYGVVSHSTIQRTREIGVRMALGAQRSEILRTILTQSLRPVLWGSALGLVLAWAFTRTFRSLLFGVNPTDPATFALVILMLLGVALLSSLIPTIRAARSDVLEALRRE